MTLEPEMDKKSFLQAGHTPTLIAAFLYFDLAFMVWVLLGPLAVGIAADLGLSHAEKGLMVATPRNTPSISNSLNECTPATQA